MPISNINRIKTVSIKLATDNSEILTIYESTGLKIGDELIPKHQIISLNTFFKNLRAMSQIASVNEATMPDFTLDDSETDKLYKTLDIEWKSPRKQLSLYISSQAVTSPTGSGWFKVGSLSLLNPSGYPYRIYNLMDLYTDNLAIELGDNSKIGVSVDDVGFGLLDATDTVVIHGSYVEEFFVVSPEPTYTTYVGGTTNTVPATIQFPLNAVFRISADDIQLSNGALVSSWQQPFTSNVLVSQNTLDSQPIYQTNVINGKSAVLFDGINDFFSVQTINNSSIPLSLIPTERDWLIFLVAKFNTPTTYAISAFNPNTGEGIPSVNLGGTDTLVARFNEYGNFNELIANYAPSADWGIYMIRREGSLIRTYINGVPYEVGGIGNNLGTGTDYLEQMFVGCKYDNTSYLNGSIASLGIVINHTNADINTLGNYFKTLYNLPWINI